MTIDDSATSWRSGSITVVDVDHDLIPKTPADALAPYGNDLSIRSGYVLPDGSIEQVPIALLRIVVGEPTARGGSSPSRGLTTTAESLLVPGSRESRSSPRATPAPRPSATSSPSGCRS